MATLTYRNCHYGEHKHTEKEIELLQYFFPEDDMYLEYDNVIGLWNDGDVIFLEENALQAYKDQ
jgi:hypothetical protein